jgi:hypothetical protein
MARVLSTFPAATTLQRRYPWDEWLDGQPWELDEHEDFKCKPNTLRANAQIQAKRRGGRVRTRLLTRDGRIVIVMQFLRS